MSEHQPSENDRQQRLAELQARLERLTAERKAELQGSQPPSDQASAALTDGEAPAATDESPVPSAAVERPQAPDPAPSPVPEAPAQADESQLPATETSPGQQPAAVPPVAAASAPPDPERPVWLSGMPPVEATPVEARRAEAMPAEGATAEAPQVEATPTEGTAAEAAPVEAAPAARIGKRSPWYVAASALAGRINGLAVDAKRAVGGLGRKATAKPRSATRQRPSSQPQTMPEVERPVASEEAAESPAKKSRSLRAAILVGFGLIGGVALMQFGGFDLPELLEGALPAAESDDAESPVAEAVGSVLPGQKSVDPVAGGSLTTRSALDERTGPVDETPAEVWTAPPRVEIASPDAEDVTAVDLDLAPLEPVVSVPTPISSSSSPPATGNPTQRPTFIPYDVAPRLENPGEIQRLLERVYPSQLRDAGIDGTVILWILVDEQGIVQKMEVKESSGYELMDEAALSAAEKMTFTPAMNRDKTTAVWLAQPITFR